MQALVGTHMRESFPAALETDAPGIYRKAILSGDSHQLPELRYGDDKIPDSVFSVIAVPIDPARVAIVFDNITERVHALQEQARIEQQMRLPAAAGRAQAVGAGAQSDKQVWSPQGRILVVDDEETVRAVTRSYLETMGFEVTTAQDGEQGIEALNEDLDGTVAVILDLTMPRVDGMETFSRIRAMKPRLPVLLISGYNEQEAIRHFTGKGLAGFLQKPYDYDKLYRKLRTVLTRRP